MRRRTRRARGASLGGWRRLDVDKLDLENQRRVRPDLSAGALRTICKVSWNEELILRALLHQLQRFGPTFDHPIDLKSSRLIAFVGTVELRPIDQRAAIIGHNGIGFFWRRTGTFLEDFVLQTRWP